MNNNSNHFFKFGFAVLSTLCIMAVQPMWKEDAQELAQSFKQLIENQKRYNPQSNKKVQQKITVPTALKIVKASLIINAYLENDYGTIQNLSFNLTESNNALEKAREELEKTQRELDILNTLKEENNKKEVARQKLIDLQPFARGYLARKQYKTMIDKHEDQKQKQQENETILFEKKSQELFQPQDSDCWLEVLKKQKNTAYEIFSGKHVDQQYHDIVDTMYTISTTTKTLLEKLYKKHDSLETNINNHFIVIARLITEPIIDYRQIKGSEKGYNETIAFNPHHVWNEGDFLQEICRLMFNCSENTLKEIHSKFIDLVLVIDENAILEAAEKKIYSRVTEKYNKDFIDSFMLKCFRDIKISENGKLPLYKYEHETLGNKLQKFWTHMKYTYPAYQYAKNPKNLTDEEYNLIMTNNVNKNELDTFIKFINEHEELKTFFEITSEIKKVSFSGLLALKAPNATEWAQKWDAWMNYIPSRLELMQEFLQKRDNANQSNDISGYKVFSSKKIQIPRIYRLMLKFVEQLYEKTEILLEEIKKNPYTTTRENIKFSDLFDLIVTILNKELENSPIKNYESIFYANYVEIYDYCCKQIENKDFELEIRFKNAIEWLIKLDSKNTLLYQALC